MKNEMKPETRVEKAEFSLPDEWQVIGPVEKDRPLSPEWLTQIPESLVAFGEKRAPQKVKAESGRLDLGPLLPGSGLGRSALVYIPFTSDCHQTVMFGFGADWWLDAYLDGERVVDTLAEGNLYCPPSVADHLKIVALEKGRHLLAIRFTSGIASAVLCAACSNDMDTLCVVLARTLSTRAILSLPSWQNRALLQELLGGKAKEY